MDGRILLSIPSPSRNTRCFTIAVAASTMFPDPPACQPYSINHSGWGAKFIDYDNDGAKDLFFAQGHVMDNIEMTQPDVRYLIWSLPCC